MQITASMKNKSMKSKHLIVALSYALSLTSAVLHGADTVTPDLKAIPSGKGWSLTPGFKAEVVDLNGKAAVRIIASDRKGLDGALARLEGVTFESGEIEVDILAPQGTRSAFVGIAFRIQDEKQMDLVYFRPQKFGEPKKKGDLVGEVQYSSEPKYGWSRLRNKFPLKYEKRLPKAPENQAAWFHARIVVEGAKVRVYVDGATEPCLTVEESLSGRTQGGVGLWTWSGGAFANLKITPRN